jgi:hypothetical protein
MTQFTRVVDGSTELRAALFNDLQESIEGIAYGVESLGVVANDSTSGVAANNAALINAHMATLTNTGTDAQNVGKAMLFPPEPVYISGPIEFPQNLYSLAWHGMGGGSTFNGTNGSGLVQITSGEHVLDMTQEAISHNAPKIIGMNFQGVAGTATIKIRNWNRGTLQNCYIFASGAPCIDGAVEDFGGEFGDCAWWHLNDVHFTGPFTSAILSDNFTFQMTGGEMTAVDADGSEPPGGHYGFNGLFTHCGAFGVKTDGCRHIIRGTFNQFHVQSEILEGENQAWLIGNASWDPDDDESEDFAYLTRDNTFHLKIAGRGTGISAPIHYGEWARSNFAQISTHNVSGTYTEDTDWRGAPKRNTTITVGASNENDGWNINQPVEGVLLEMHNSHYGAHEGKNILLHGNESASIKILDLDSPNGAFVRNSFAYFCGDGTVHILQNLAHGAGRSDAVAPKVGFYGTAPIAKQTGVAVDAAGIHAALVALGLIGA